MGKNEIFDVLKNALIELFEIEEDKIQMSAKIYEDLEIDSIDAIDLVAFVKQKTGYKLMPEDFKQIQTLEDIVNLVEKKVEK